MTEFSLMLSLERWCTAMITKDVVFGVHQCIWTQIIKETHMLPKITITRNKAALVLKGALLAALLIVGTQILAALKNSPMIVDYAIGQFAFYLLLVVLVLQIVELVLVNPAQGQKWFGAYKMLTVATTLVAVLALYLPNLVGDLTTALQIACVASYFTALIDGVETLYL